MQELNLKYKYGDTVFGAFYNRCRLIKDRYTNEVFYLMKWVLYWMGFAWIVAEIFMTPFWFVSKDEKMLVRVYLLQRYAYKEKHSYSDLIRYKKDGTLETNLRRAMKIREPASILKDVTK